jgi:hypothetical protein
MMDWIGWVATATFLASYACTDPKKLRLTQAAAALLWVAYGSMLHAWPMIVANLLVTAVAVYSALGGVLSFKRASRSPVRPGDEPGLSRTS